MTLDDAIRKISKAKSKVNDFMLSEIGDTFDLIDLCYKAFQDGDLDSNERLDRVLEDADRIINNLSIKYLSQEIDDDIWLCDFDRCVLIFSSREFAIMGKYLYGFAVGVFVVLYSLGIAETTGSLLKTLPVTVIGVLISGFCAMKLAR